jgi:hypothetical protein
MCQRKPGYLLSNGVGPQWRREDFGVNPGAMATRGERNTLIVSIDSLNRMSSNPFFPYMLARIEEGIDTGSKGVSPLVASSAHPRESASGRAASAAGPAR